MSYLTGKRISSQIDCCRKDFDSTQGLPFAEHLPAERIERVLKEENISFRRRVFMPARTLWVFLSQVFSADHSCCEAVARFVAYLTGQGEKPCSPRTGSYCQARQKLPENVLARLVRETGREPHEQADDGWQLAGRPVKVVDGTTVSMPDTPENQAVFPQQRAQKPGLGFPLARVMVVFSLAVGTVLEMAIGPYKGKQTSEISLFRKMGGAFRPGDIMLADRVLSSYIDIAMLQQGGVDVVVRKNETRRTDFRRGRRLGKHDHLVHWHKPSRCPDWLDAETFAGLPEQLTLREIKIHVAERGMRTRELVVVTTLLDPQQYSQEAIGELYRVRWNAELDLRSLKTSMQMDVLRTKTPEMVRKEVWMHMLAYNLVRCMMAEAARQAGILPRQISFKGTLQILNAYHDYLIFGLAERAQILAAIASHRVASRPNRTEPRAVKRRPKPHKFLVVPRQQARTLLLKTTSR